MSGVGAGRLVLIVEDNDRNLKLLRDVLSFHGFSILAATTGEDGVALAAAHRPDVILMDIALPGIDGIEATRRLKAEAATAAIPTVAVTASAMQADRARIEAAGFAGSIIKPIDVVALPREVLGYCTAPPGTGDG